MNSISFISFRQPLHLAAVRLNSAIHVLSSDRASRCCRYRQRKSVGELCWQAGLQQEAAAESEESPESRQVRAERSPEGS